MSFVAVMTHYILQDNLLNGSYINPVPNKATLTFKLLCVILVRMEKDFIPAILLKQKVLTYIEYRAVSGVFRTIDPPPPLHPASVCTPSAPKAGGYTHSPVGEGWGGSIVRKTPDIGLASYSIIPLRSEVSLGSNCVLFSVSFRSEGVE
jgi:hypothetical protein